MPRLAHLAPACLVLSCVSGGSNPASVESGTHICGPREHYSTDPEDCFNTPTNNRASVETSLEYAEGEAWTAWQGLCLVKGSDRLNGVNGVCELQESLSFSRDCKTGCGNNQLDGGEEMTCIHDWLANDRQCKEGPEICAGKTDCGNGTCEYDAIHKEDACTCPEDCTNPDQYWAIRNPDGTCEAREDAPAGVIACSCGNTKCERFETEHSCDEDCPEQGMSTSTTDDTTAGSTAGSTTGTTDDTSSDTSPPPCDEDPACGLDETVETCPEQCSVCGDGIQSGAEKCDNGEANQTYWPQPPLAGACSENCDESFTYCGDGFPNGGEVCDNGPTNQTYWSTKPPEEACSETCDKKLSFCGDGIIDEPAGETCDDLNLDEFDGCDSACNAQCIVFVTATPYQGDLGGQDPDKICANAASFAGLFGSYKAWLSTANASAAERLTPCTTPPLLRDGTPVADDWMGFLSGALKVPLALTETGMEPDSKKAGGLVWTGTRFDGSAAADRCNGWGSSSNFIFGQVGSFINKSKQWTDQFTNSCDLLGHLYCIQQPG